MNLSRVGYPQDSMLQRLGLAEGGSQEIDSLIGRDLLKVMPAAVKRCEHVTTDLDVYINRGSCNVTCSYNLQRMHPPDTN